MFNFSVNSQTIIFKVKEVDGVKKYRIIIKSCLENEQDLKIKGVDLKGFLKIMKIHSIRITDEVASIIEDYLISVKPNEINCGILVFDEENRNKSFIVKTENGDEKYFAIKKLYDVAKSSVTKEI